MAQTAVKRRLRAVEESQFEINDAADADKAITELARLDVAIAAESAEFNEEAISLQTEAADKVRPLVAQKISIVERLTEWAVEVYDELKKKTLEFTVGSISMKKGSTVVEWLPGCSEDSAIEVLRRRPTLQHLVKTSTPVTSVDLNELKKLDAKLHAEIGFQLVQQDPSVTINVSIPDYEKMVAGELRKKGKK